MLSRRLVPDEIALAICDERYLARKIPAQGWGLWRGIEILASPLQSSTYRIHQIDATDTGINRFCNRHRRSHC
jgi:hypothetical protein